MNEIILTTSKCDTLKPLSIQFRLFANSVCDNKYHKWCGVNDHYPCNPHSTSIGEQLTRCTFTTILILVSIPLVLVHQSRMINYPLESLIPHALSKLLLLLLLPFTINFGEILLVVEQCVVSKYYRRFIASSTHVSRIIILKRKICIRLKKTYKISTFATFSTTLSDNFQKNQLFFLRHLVSDHLYMNLRYVKSGGGPDSLGVEGEG